MKIKVEMCRLCGKHPLIEFFFCEYCLSRKKRDKTFEPRIKIICKWGKYKK